LVYDIDVISQSYVISQLPTHAMQRCAVSLLQTIYLILLLHGGLTLGLVYDLDVISQSYVIVQLPTYEMQCCESTSDKTL
jgi:hypothetical protein